MRKTSRYSYEQNQEMRFRVLDILNHSNKALTNDEIRQGDILLNNVTSQKISRILGELSEVGTVTKIKDKNKGGKMVYSLTSKVEGWYND